MSRIKIIFYAALALIVGSHEGYGAVRPITEAGNGFAVFGTAVPQRQSSEGCGDIAACTTSCSLSDNATGYQCEEAGQCCDNGQVVPAYKCPADFRYDASVDYPKEADFQICTGTNTGGYDGRWATKDPEACSNWTDNGTYLTKLSTNSSCDGNWGEHYVCIYSGQTRDFCVLNRTIGLQKCPDNNNYTTTPQQCSGGYNSALCYVDCGNGMFCEGYTCDLGNIPNCNDLIKEKREQGILYPTSLGDSGSSLRPYACLDQGVEKFIGFGMDKDGNECHGEYPIEDEYTCEEGNGKNANTCKVDGGTDRYRCGCNYEGEPQTYKTLQEHCGNNATCLQTNYGTGTLCTADKDADGNALYKYETFESEIELCSVLEQTSILTDLDGGTCEPVKDDVYEDITYPLLKVQCRILHEDTYETEILDKCQGCLALRDLTEAGGTCSPGTALVCPYQAAGSSPVAAGCQCPADDGWMTIAQWCEANGSDIDNCQSIIAGKGEECQIALFDGSYTDGGYYKEFECGEGYQTLAEFCAANPDISENHNCETDYIGLGAVCKAESPDDEKGWKYRGFGLSCSALPEESVMSDTENCLLEGEEEAYYEACYEKVEGELPVEKYVCKCPPSYGTECENDYEIRGGTKCVFDYDAAGSSITKYAQCYLVCGHEYASASSATAYGCPEIFGDYVSSIRGGTSNPEMCAVSDSRELSYICGCPDNFKTIDEWCESNYKDEGLDSASECISSYNGIGTSCSRDIKTDADGKPVEVLTKYAGYARYCPTDRPLYYGEEDCTYARGEYAYGCLDKDNVERVVCQCPLTWYAVDGTVQEGDICTTQGLGDRNFEAEPSGNYCELDGTEGIKYEECTAKCQPLLEEVALPSSYIYLDASTSTPTQNMCAKELGSGAVLGYGNQAYCSQNNTKMYPCYCPADFRECLKEENQEAAKDATSCSINGVTYWSECVPIACETPGPNLAVVDISTDVEAVFGAGAEFRICSSGDKVMKQVSCDTSVYTDTCEYPYEAPKDGSWCRYNTSGSMESGSQYYQAGACQVKKVLGACGQNIIEGETTRTDYAIFVAPSESECSALYGPGVSAQLCEYGADQGYKRAYNCYYDPDEFKYTTANCAVRHNLGGDYVIVNGQKRWRECNCSSAYQHHKFNCGGLLSGNTCQQEITRSLIASDPTLDESMLGQTLPFYPYCECSADYTEVCDEDGSGRYKGVGQACNGKYKSCECVPDELPLNWADNYYGCPGGRKPTGVWKDNGCGRKYYQCSVIECSWEYTEMCNAPQIPVGQPCQDNQGNIGGYKACACPSEYKLCPEGQVGQGEPCNLKGVSYYKSCKEEETCSSTVNNTCSGPLQIGINPCVRDDITYYERCVCANGYSEVCGDGEVGVGNYCELDGVKYYKECAKPEKNLCTPGHVTACGTNQESYSPCTEISEDGRPVVKYLCRCPGNWKSCDSGSGEKCVQKNSDGSETTYWSECNAQADTCSEYQEQTYQVCTSAQIGDGGSCASTIENSDGSSETVIKYASCQDTTNCLTNGFKYSCSGYDPATLGEFCVDANGNRLYKECPCPSGYTTCNGINTSKGKRCTPLLADGSFGPTVYASCECDQSKYKYTCQAEESGNVGIIPPDTQDYCEITEKVTQTSTDPETGATVSSTEEKKVRYYASCKCDSDYQYTCQNSSKGERVPDDYKNDYCEINSTKFYKGCDCSAEYNITAEECALNSGQKANSEGGSCTIRGLVPEISAEGEKTYKAKETLYQGCICKPSYSLTCTGNFYDQSDIEACTLNTNRPLYPRCQCSAEAQKKCIASGKNQGVIPDKNTVCTEMIADNSGGYTTEDKYMACTCKDEYTLFCVGDDKWDQSNEDYCDTGEEGADRTYRKCACNRQIYDNMVDMGGTDAKTYCESLGMIVSEKVASNEQYCTEYENSRGTLIYRYRPNRNLCCSGSNTEGYTQLDPSPYENLTELIKSYSQQGLEAKIKNLCGHEYNAVIIFDCNGYPYYKCSNTDVQSEASAGTNWYTQEQCRAQGSACSVSGIAETISSSWTQSAQVYPNCSCSAGGGS